MPVVDNPLHKNYLNGASNNIDTSYDSLTSNDWISIKSQPLSTQDGLHRKLTFGLQKSCLKASKIYYYFYFYQTEQRIIYRIHHLRNQASNNL